MKIKKSVIEQLISTGEKDKALHTKLRPASLFYQLGPHEQSRWKKFPTVSPFKNSCGGELDLEGNDMDDPAAEDDGDDFAES